MPRDPRAWLADIEMGLRVPPEKPMQHEGAAARGTRARNPDVGSGSRDSRHLTSRNLTA
jgi:hypothetical protein